MAKQSEHSIKVGVLVLVFKKSATEPQLKTSLTRCKKKSVAIFEILQPLAKMMELAYL